MDEQTKRTLKMFEKMEQEDEKELRPRYMALSRAARRYRVSRDKMEDRAKKAGAYYKINDSKILIDLDVMDEYFNYGKDPEEDEWADFNI